MENQENSNVLILDPKILLKKVVERYGSNPIFPEKVEEIRKNIHKYREFDLENKSLK